MPQAAVKAEKFLRVSTPKTIDGVTLAYDDENRPIYHVVHLPFSAKGHLDRANSKRPKHLQHKIEVIEGDLPEPKNPKVKFEK